MFARHCTSCDKRQLIFPSAITGMVKLAEGHAVTYTCWCGADQVWLTAGEPTAAAEPVERALATTAA
jgi:hypothetical protein